MVAEMSFPVSYRDNLLQTIQTIDENKVNQAIDWFREARDQGRVIFVAGNGGSAATAVARPQLRISCAT